MTEKSIRVCDNQRCGKELTGPYQQITLHTHHEKRLDLCMDCFDTFKRWLNPEQVSPGRDGSEVENS